MKAYPRKKADLDPLSLGTVVHHVMEALLKRPGFEGCTSKTVGTVDSRNIRGIFYFVYGWGHQQNRPL